MTLAGTGHRPDKLGGYSSDIYEKLSMLIVPHLKSLEPHDVMSGMAQGFDWGLCKAALQVSVPFIAVVPFVGQERLWPKETQKEYLRLLELASDVLIVSEGKFSTTSMQLRNEYLVDHSHVLLSLWDGSPGGTANCNKYARKKDRLTIQLWKEWENLKAEIE